MSPVGPLPPLKRIRADEPPDLRVVPARAQVQQLAVLIPVLPRKQMALLPAAGGGAGESSRIGRAARDAQLPERVGGHRLLYLSGRIHRPQAGAQVPGQGQQIGLEDRSRTLTRGRIDAQLAQQAVAGGGGGGAGCPVPGGDLAGQGLAGRARLLLL